MAAGILARDTEPFTNTKVVANTMWTSQPQLCLCTGEGRTVGCARCQLIANNAVEQPDTPELSPSRRHAPAGTIVQPLALRS